MNFSFVAIQTCDLAGSLAFYQEVMGMSVTRRFTAGPDQIVMLKGEGCGVELISGPEGPRTTAGGHPVLGFDVDDLDRVVEAMRAKGVTILEGPCSPNPGVRFVMVLDPNGIKLELLEHR
jgi:lactoylglutathione lyase